MKTTPTFFASNYLHVGQAAIDAWSAQTARCACGCRATERNFVSGKCEDMPASWLGCPNCRGQACGLPLVYRTQSQINFETAHK